jgi:K(+)-stimulated pyrophosphate-energized sodium pump
LLSLHGSINITGFIRCLCDVYWNYSGVFSKRHVLANATFCRRNDTGSFLGFGYMNSVGKAAMDMVYEVRRQFREIPGIMEGTGKPEYAMIVFTNPLRNDVTRNFDIGFPIAFFRQISIFRQQQLIAEMLGGYMAGVTVSGGCFGLFSKQCRWCLGQRQKIFEAGVLINGEMTYKGSDAHKAVTGDTVGDPFKDTVPSMNI